MDREKCKNIAFVVGFFEGHITCTIELVKDLVSLGHNITLYVLDQYSERYKMTGAKLKIYSIEKKDLYKTENSLVCLTMVRSLDAVLTQAQKEQEKFDYLIVDSLLDGKEMNKIFKASTVISIFTCQYALLPFDFIKQFNQEILKLMIPLNKKFNLEMMDYFTANSYPNSKYKLFLTSREFHSKIYQLDDSFFFIGPSIEDKPIDKSFPFKKDLNKKLIYISLGTIYNDNIDFFKKCIEAFGSSKEFQLIISVGKLIDIKKFGNVPENIYIYNFVPQLQILKEADIFISHGGLNSINERLFLAEKPIIVVPQFGDQYLNAYQVAILECGITLEKEKITVDILKNAVNSIITDKEKFNNGVQNIVKSFKNARNERENKLKKIFI